MSRIKNCLGQIVDQIQNIDSILRPTLRSERGLKKIKQSSFIGGKVREISRINLLAQLQAVARKRDRLLA